MTRRRLKRAVKDVVADGVFRVRRRRRRELLRRRVCRILMYHAIEQAPRDDDPLGMVVPLEMFAMHLQWIRDDGLAVIALSELVDAMAAQRPLPEGAVAITFDDGYRGVLTCALPMLKAFGFPATLFANIAFIERTLCPGVYLAEWPTLTWEELRALPQEGMTIGSHALTHERLNRMTTQRIAEEIRRSKELLEAHTQRPVDLFSYPHGAFDERAIRALQDHGFSAACSSMEGVNDGETDRFLLRRTEMTAFDHTPERCEKKLLGCYDWLRWVRPA